MATGRKPIKIVPHFMRLHEWIALERGYYQEEGLEPQLLDEVMHQVSGFSGTAYKERPQDRPFLEGLEVANSACHWGSVCNAGAGMGKFVPDVYGVARFGIYVRGDSRIQRLEDLAGVPIGVGIMAGSHFTALQTLEKHLPREQIVIRNFGGPGRRLVGLLNGEIEAGNLLDPEIPIADQKGLRKIVGGEFKTLFWVDGTLRSDVLNGYFRALKKADAELRRNPAAYMGLWARNIPPELQGDYDLSRFGPGELLVFERYSEEEYRQTMAWVRSWGLDREVRESRYDRLIVSVAV